MVFRRCPRYRIALLSGDLRLPGSPGPVNMLAYKHPAASLTIGLSGTIKLL